MYPMNAMMNSYQNNYPNMNNYSNMYSSQNYSQPQSQTNLIRVNGLEGAKAYQMGANSQMALFDNNEDILYVKITDGAGFPTIRTFKFTEFVDSQPQQEDESYVKREDLESFRKEIEDYVKQFIPKSKNDATK